MPTKAEWEGMGRKVDMRIDGLTSAEIRKAYQDGLQEGERRGWELGKEAAAEKLEQMAAELLVTAKRFESPFIGNAMAGQAEAYRLGAAAIRKLRKP